MQLIDTFKDYFRQFTILSDEEWITISKYFEIRMLSKNEFLLKQGEICNLVAYISYGTLIYIKITDNADEITTDFALQGEWVTDNFSRLNNSPSFINIKAFENTELFIIKHHNLVDLYEKFPKLEKFGRILTEKAFVKIIQHSIDLQILQAKERYLKLLDKYPEIFQKIPLFHIANYLGIAPKSLSRIRKEITGR
jgi:CRP/FNR family transcriptional regulator, anaerobic regulatory protein